MVRTAIFLLAFGWVSLLWTECYGETPTASSESDDGKIVLTHFMPWFEKLQTANLPFDQKEHTKGLWGWHWTMNAVVIETETITDRGPVPKIASHYRPAIGPYDSGDPHVLEYQLLTMKLSGIDGVIVDWYGLEDFRDYAMLHRNTLKLVDAVARLRMKFAICYEDQTIPALVEADRMRKEDRVVHAVNELRWLRDHWFHQDSYVQLQGRPLLLSFGQSGLTDEEWSNCMEHFASPISYFSLHHKRHAALGAFDWPIPKMGKEAIGRFYREAPQWKSALPVVYPRFHDYYSQAKVGESYGEVSDNEGKTFRELWDRAWQSKYPIIQLATWNDWGEGTQLEPSVEFGYRDLEIIQGTIRSKSPQRVPPHANDIKLARDLYQLRIANRHSKESLDRVAMWLVDGNWDQARRILGQLAVP